MNDDAFRTVPCDGSIDIVLVNYHMSGELAVALEGLGFWCNGTVWIVDNSCDAKEAAALRRLAKIYPCIRILTAAQNLGFGRGCNWAWQLSDAPHVLLLNPDACVSPSDIKNLSSTLSKCADLGAVSPLTFWNPERTFLLPRPSNQLPWSHAFSAFCSRTPWITRRLANRMVDKTRLSTQAVNGLIEVSMLAGATLLLKRRAVEVSGGLFDPAYFMFFEDADLSLRLRKSGYRLAIEGQCRAVHTYRHRAYKGDLMAASQLIYFTKNFPIFASSGMLQKFINFCQIRQIPELWFDVLPGRITDVNAFNEATGYQGVIAFSPSLLMFPAIARPHDQPCSTWSDAEWALLEPGRYVALLEGRKRWVLFEK